MMKNKKMLCLGLLIIVAFTLNCGMFTREAQLEWLNPGTTLIYEVNPKGSSYDFIMDVTSLTPDIHFNWQMTDPVNKEGSILMEEAALQDAIGQYNYFSERDEVLDNATSVWVSKKVYTELKENGKVTINPQYNMAETVDLLLENKEVMNVTVDGEEVVLDVLHAKNDEDDYVYWILDNPEHPMILHMIFDKHNIFSGFEIKIKEISTE